MARLALLLIAALVAAGSAGATIPPQRDPIRTLSIADATTHETNVDTVAVLDVTLSGPSGDPVTVNWATADGTADSTDYVPDSGTLTFGPGQIAAQIAVMIKGDALDEPDETVFVQLSGANHATIDRGRATLTIVDDDPVLDKARETAALLASKSNVALRIMKELANRALGGEHGANLRTEGEMFGELFAGEDAKEGLSAFVEKREPVFKGT